MREHVFRGDFEKGHFLDLNFVTIYLYVSSAGGCVDNLKVASVCVAKCELCISFINIIHSIPWKERYV